MVCYSGLLNRSLVLRGFDSHQTLQGELVVIVYHWSLKPARHGCNSHLTLQINLGVDMTLEEQARQLEEQQRDLLEADLAIKTGAATIGSAVERFIVKHSTSGRNSRH